MVNWTVTSIFEARGRTVTSRNGTVYPVQLDETGWRVGPFDHLDIWQACSVLNHIEATPTAATTKGA